MTDLIKRAEKYYRELSPHAANREGGKLIKELLTELANQWLPIDDAPKDLTSIIVSWEKVESYGDNHCAYFSAKHSIETPPIGTPLQLQRLCPDGRHAIIATGWRHIYQPCHPLNQKASHER